MLTHVYAKIVKREKQADGTMLVSGPVADSGLDRDEQICDPAWLDRAVPAWFAESGNIREQHSTLAAGKALTLSKQDGAHWITARVVDAGSVTKVENDVLSGFSIGIKRPRLTLDKHARGGRIVDGKIVEVSLVDRPANPRCLLTLAKADSAEQLQAVEDPDLVEKSEDPAAATEPEPTVVHDGDGWSLLVKGDLPETVRAVLFAAVNVNTDPEALTVTDTKTDATKTEEPAAPATEPPAPDIADIVKSSIAEAIKPLQEENALLKADMAKVLALPAPGGPQRMRTTSETADAVKSDHDRLRAEADALLEKADQSSGAVAMGYRQRAEAILTKLA